MTTDITQKLVKTWTLTGPKGQTLRVATIEQGERRPNPMCPGCKARCCRRLGPVLNETEFLNKKFQYTFMPAPKYITKFAPVDYRKNLMLVVIASLPNGDCVYRDDEKLICTAWPNVPQACLNYDCRLDTRWDVKLFVAQRTQEWEAQQRCVHK